MSIDSIEFVEPGAALDQVSMSSIKTVAFASLVGTMIEWYDFFVFSSMTGIVFNKLFFPANDPLVSTLLAYATFAIGFVVRPLGGAISGHFGDKIGRRPLLIFSLGAMGLATFFIGLLPTYASIGLAAPLLLLLLRILQGLALGGEWGGAVLMAYEHAEDKNRVFYSSYPQIGLAVGLCLSSATIAVLSAALSNAEFLEWGWRIPFLLSLLMLAVGLFIRLRVLETPKFVEIKKNSLIVKSPIGELLKSHKRTIGLGWVANLAMGIPFAVYCVYSIPMLTGIGYSRGAVLSWIAVAGLLLVLTIPYFASLADRYGTRRVYITAALVNAAAVFPALWIMRYSGSIVLTSLTIIITFGIGWAPLYGPLAALYCELFDARLRYTGISLGYNIGAVISISMTPIIATYLVALSSGTPWLLASYMVVAGVLAVISVAAMGKKYR